MHIMEKYAFSIDTPVRLNKEDIVDYLSVTDLETGKRTINPRLRDWLKTDDDITDETILKNDFIDLRDKLFYHQQNGDEVHLICGKHKIHVSVFCCSVPVSITLGYKIRIKILIKVDGHLCLNFAGLERSSDAQRPSSFLVDLTINLLCLLVIGFIIRNESRIHDTGEMR